MKNIILFIAALAIITGCSQAAGSREKISLNGKWDIAKTNSFSEFPTTYSSKVPVPGLVDLALPTLDTNRLFNSGVYWYKTKFTIDKKYPELVQLKIGKAKYHARVYVNGQFAGEQVYCFTSANIDVRGFLNQPGTENELIIGLGTWNNMPDTVIWGKDIEKVTYIPGIYDDVSLTMSGYPFIDNIQTVPMIGEEKVRVVADIDAGGDNRNVILSYQIKELKSGNVVAEGSSESKDFTISIPGCKLWSPESPFLYELKLSTRADEKTVRFGMRSFSFNAETGRAMLNGETYFMRGTNVCVLRFFEDPERGLLPWTNDWVVDLHQKIKDMNWNSMRYCIGLPPERWYDIADSLGLLIQNEYPIWAQGKPDGIARVYPGITAAHVANEFRDWLPEHWNHPSVVIWDAQNETVSDITSQAIRMVRNMDLSNRPWENGWSTPQSDTDPIETHPYLFMRYRRAGAPSEKGALSDLMNTIHIPANDVNEHNPPKDKQRHTNPMIINEYEWLWLNRDGSTTTLTDRVYDVVFGKNLTTQERIHHYCRYLGMITEYWRAHRQCAGVLHFCALGYSRPFEPRGQTSDHFIDIKNLVYEPEFVKYVKPSFSPVGLMINFWEKKVGPGEMVNMDIYAINDLNSVWQGDMTITIESDEQSVFTQQARLEVSAFGREIKDFDIKMPSKKGTYKLVAEIDYNGEKIKSIRDFSVE